MEQPSSPKFLQLNQKYAQTENYDIKVGILQELKNALPFFKARPPSGIFFGFLGFRHEVVPLLQKISHGTRAYIINADGLHGFVHDLDIAEILRRADKCGLLDEAKKWQEIDFDIIEY